MDCLIQDQLFDKIRELIKEIEALKEQIRDMNKIIDIQGIEIKDLRRSIKWTH